MEKIIYNTKLKKLIIATLIFMLVFNAMMPIAFAAVMSFDPKQFIYDQGGIPANADKIFDWNLNDWIITEDKKRTMLDNYRSPMNDPDLMQNPIYAKEVNDMVDAYGLGIDEYNKKISDAKNQGKSLQEALNIATGEAADVGDGRLEDLGNDVLDENGEDTADLGGILLSPIFYLINFVADAITSNLGRIMLGNDPSFSNVTGTKVLQGSIITSIPGKSSYYEVNADLDNVLGGVQYPNIPYTPEEIFAGKIDLLSIDFISGKNADGETITGDWTSIRTEIAKWYQVLRMVAIIGLLSVLIYTGIKIIISANAKDKAKYKEWIINWFMAVAILFAMHLIMAFIISVTGEFSKLINNACQGIKITGDGGGTVTNLMGLVRFMIQSEDFYKKVAYEIMYIALIVYTIKFTLVYLKRVLNMAFLTLIAPIVALTYPIDKINDGRAQGFDMWLKEYMFNAILQPMNQLMYYILVGSAVGVAASNPIYGIVVLMFMTEAEKLLKRIFGFDKAGGGTVGGMAGAFAAGAIASNIKNIARMAKLPSGNGNKSGSDGSSSMNTLMDNVKMKDGGIADSGEKGFLDPAFDEDNSSGRSSAGSSTSGSSASGNASTDGGSSTRNSGGNPASVDLTGDSSDGTVGSGATIIGSTGSGIYGSEPIRRSSSSTGTVRPRGPQPTNDPLENSKMKNMAAQVQAKAKEKYDNSPEKTKRIIKGVGNVGKSLARPFYDMDRDGEYNKQRWKRRGVKALKGAGKAVVGATLGTAAAAVQAGISITDGKYNPMEGMATFAAGYAGGSKIASSVGGSLANSFNEGYYSGDEGEKELIKKKQDEFKYRDDIHKKYVEDWGENADQMKELAAKQLVSYGITDTKKQKQILKLAKDIAGKDTPLDSKRMEQAVIRARKTSGFIDQLDSQGQRSTINDPDKQDKYIESVIKAQNLDAQKDKDKIDRIEKSYRAAFKSAAQWYQVNR